MCDQAQRARSSRSGRPPRHGRRVAARARVQRRRRAVDGQAALRRARRRSISNGELKWQVPHGDTPDVVRNHPKLKGMNIPKTGPGRQRRRARHQDARDCRRPAGHHDSRSSARGDDARYDKETGQEVGAVWMPAQVSGSPMTYRVGGRQFIVIAVSGGNYSGETSPSGCRRRARYRWRHE